EPPIQPNYCTLDSDGRLYYTDSGDRTAPMHSTGGSLRVVNTGGEDKILSDRFTAWANGLALSRDGSTLYVAETGTEEITAVHLTDGKITGTSFVTNNCGHVDGVALDADDDIYVASIGDNAIYRIVDGDVEVVLSDPVGLVMCNPTNVAFGGPEMRTLYIAQLGLPHVVAVEVDKPGRYPTVRL
ncbi:SMP-30/gluconolactonase/LRE family protein, partial [Haloferax marisrubri]